MTTAEANYLMDDLADLVERHHTEPLEFSIMENAQGAFVLVRIPEEEK